MAKKKGSDTLMELAATVFIPPWLLMFGVAQLGHPFGYWRCVVLALAFDSVFGSAVYAGVKLALRDAAGGNL